MVELIQICQSTRFQASFQRILKSTCMCERERVCACACVYVFVCACCSVGESKLICELVAVMHNDESELLVW